MLTLPASLVALSFPVTRIYLGKLVIGFNILSTTLGHTWGWTNTVFSQCTFKTLLDLKLYENQIYRLSPNTYTTWEISLQTWSSLLWMESQPPFPAYMHFSFQCAPFFLFTHFYYEAGHLWLHKPQCPYEQWSQLALQWSYIMTIVFDAIDSSEMLWDPVLCCCCYCCFIFVVF